MQVKFALNQVVHKGYKGGVTGCGINTNNEPEFWNNSSLAVTCEKNGCREVTDENGM